MRFAVILALLLGSIGDAAAHERLNARPGRTVVVTTSISILETIRFRPGTTTIVPASVPMLDAIAATLAGNPDIRLIEILVRAATGGLAARRGRKIVESLVARGIPPERLRSAGVRDPRSSDTEIYILERGADPDAIGP